MSIFTSTKQLPNVAVLTLEIEGKGIRAQVSYEDEAGLKAGLVEASPKLVDQLNEAIYGEKAAIRAGIDAKIAELTEQRKLVA